MSARDFDDLPLEEFSGLHRECFGGPLDGAWVRIRHGITDLAFPWPRGWYYLGGDQRYHWRDRPETFTARDAATYREGVRVVTDYPPDGRPRGVLG